MDSERFAPHLRAVTTGWYCAFGSTPRVCVRVSGDGSADRLELTADLDTVDGIRERWLAGISDASGELPSATDYNFVGDLAVPASADVKPFCVGIICLLTALWTDQLRIEHLRRGQHEHAEFFAAAMRVLGQDNPLSRVVNGSTLPPAERYAF